MNGNYKRHDIIVSGSMRAMGRAYAIGARRLPDHATCKNLLKTGLITLHNIMRSGTLISRGGKSLHVFLERNSEEPKHRSVKSTHASIHILTLSTVLLAWTARTGGAFEHVYEVYLTESTLMIPILDRTNDTVVEGHETRGYIEQTRYALR